ncbi:uncharacterized protein LOC128832239 [Malaclemys terrapin pileata]|uniref:uncharacterized protein LOC128832239 n=1 Tax=Malaclemys terrapin pileata TaxID=2991368 RepID=UPI0023A7C40F|nr:uncharacterized protein LOC128832239 [Malaclemys terrapin pileata]
MPVLTTLVITLNSTALPSGDQPSDPHFKFSGNFEKSPSCLLSQAWSALSESFQLTMPPHSRRAPVWSNGELLDLSSVWGEEAVQSQLRCSRMNYDTFGQISRDMLERGHDQDAVQCRVKVKELRNAYHKACEANRRSGAAPTTCRFYKELDAILGGDPTSTLGTTMDTLEPSATRQEQEEEEEEQSGSKGAEAEEDTPESLDACSQELFSSQEEGGQSQRPVLGEGQTPEAVPNATLRSQPFVLSPAERLQRIRKRPRRSKEDMLHEVMPHSSNEIKKCSCGGRVKGGSASRMRIAGTKAQSGC